MTKHKRTQEDWIEIGNNVKKMRNELLDVDVAVGNQVGVTNESYKKIAKAYALVERACSDLEDQMFREYPHLSNYWLNLFYGPEDSAFDPNSEEAKHYEQYPLGLDGGLKEKKKWLSRKKKK